ncbi:MAG: ASCH domain-containing protein [Deltaproteobacteria bacterium]|nr:ASCH domain-containing protein [Nannocystaceae bacterium]
MLLFKKPFWEGLQAGRITLTFRRWQKPHVRVGGRYRCHPIGVLEVDDVRLVPSKSITAVDAERAGFASRRELLAYLAELGPLEPDTPVYRVELHHGGDGDRVELALEAELDDAAIEIIRAKLARMDAETPWTAATLAIIERLPRVAAAKLAVELGREKLELKADIRKLKRLGLTQSFEVGYEIAPRGRAYLDATASLGGQRAGPSAPGRAPDGATGNLEPDVAPPRRTASKAERARKSAGRRDQS